MSETDRAPRPLGLVAELTYRCPLRCPYCSNPVDLEAFPETLSAEDWGRVFGEAAELGCVHAGLTGGEPSTRRDLPEIVAAAARAGLYTHLVTAGLPLDAQGLAHLARMGLRSVQVSVQDAESKASDALAGTPSFARKLEIARATRRLGLPLTLNVVLHRHNLERVPELVALARELDADRLELANAQYHGWALRNRSWLLPSEAQVAEAARAARAASEAARRPEILFVLPDYLRQRPKPCMGGWGRIQMVVRPDGRVLPCHGAAEIPGLTFWRVPERPLAACWREAPGMNAFRGQAWMGEPCRSCPERGRDFGGCRCQAAALLGDPAATDPVCALSPQHAEIQRALDEARGTTSRGFAWRQMRRAGPRT